MEILISKFISTNHKTANQSKINFIGWKKCRSSKFQSNWLARKARRNLVNGLVLKWFSEIYDRPFLKVPSFAKTEQSSDYCLSWTQDSQSESCEPVKFIDKNRPQSSITWCAAALKKLQLGLEININKQYKVTKISKH